MTLQRRDVLRMIALVPAVLLPAAVGQSADGAWQQELADALPGPEDYNWGEKLTNAFRILAGCIEELERRP